METVMQVLLVLVLVFIGYHLRRLHEKKLGIDLAAMVRKIVTDSTPDIVGSVLIAMGVIASVDDDLTKKRRLGVAKKKAKKKAKPAKKKSAKKKAPAKKPSKPKTGKKSPVAPAAVPAPEKKAETSTPAAPRPLRTPKPLAAKPAPGTPVPPPVERPLPEAAEAVGG
jgi:hypothetical protein